jgi:hypothetical protein
MLRRGVRTSSHAFKINNLMWHNERMARARWLTGASPLARELMAIRERGVPDLAPNPRVDIPNLMPIALKVCQLPNDVTQAKAVSSILLLAIDRLQDNREKGAALKLFAMAPGTKGKSLERRQGVAGDEYGRSAYAFRDNSKDSRRYEQTLILSLVAAIEELQSGTRTEVTPLDQSNGYITRRALEHEFFQAVSAGHTVISLVGDSGVGKSRLAVELTRSQGSATELFVIDKDEPIAAMCRLLVFSGVVANYFQAAILKESQVKSQFLSLLRSGEAPPYVVVDGLERASRFVSKLVEARTNSRLVITSTMSLGLGYEIKVSDMDPEEAVELVRSRTDNLSDEEIEKIAKVAGYRPLVIVQSCDLLRRKEELKASDLEEGVRFHPSLFFEMAEPEWTLRFTTYYERMLSELSQHSRPSIAVLQLLCVTRFVLPEKQLLRDITAWLLGVKNLRLADAIADDAMDQLEKKSILVRDGNNVHVNYVVRHVLRELLEDQTAPFFGAVALALGGVADLYHQNGDLDSLALVRELWASCEIVQMKKVEVERAFPVLYTSPAQRDPELITDRESGDDYDDRPVRTEFLMDEEFLLHTSVRYRLRRTLRIVCKPFMMVADLVVILFDRKTWIPRERRIVTPMLRISRTMNRPTTKKSDAVYAFLEDLELVEKLIDEHGQ